MLKNLIKFVIQLYIFHLDSVRLSESLHLKFKRLSLHLRRLLRETLYELS